MATRLSKLYNNFKRVNIFAFLVSLIAITILNLHLNRTISFIKNSTDSFALATGLFIPFFLLFLGYGQLRDTTVYIIWLLLGIGMLLFYFELKDSPALQMKRGSALRSFKSLFLFLILFQLVRMIFVKVTGREYITPSIGGTNDIIENKKPQLADFIMFGFLFLSIIAAQEIYTSHFR